MRDELERRVLVAAAHDTELWSRLHRPFLRGRSYQMYPYQIGITNDLDADRGSIVLKSRQTGISVTSMAHVLSRSLRGQQGILVVSTGQDESRDWLRKCKNMMRSCVPSYPLVPLADNMDRIDFSNGSFVESSPSTEDTGRGGTYDLVILDEAETLRNVDLMWASIAPTMSHGGHVCIISTPGLHGSWFNDRWQRADELGLSRHSAHWRECPTCDDAWFAEWRPQYTLRQWQSEYELQWGQSGEALYRSDSVEACIELADGWIPSERPSWRMGIDLSGDGSARTIVCVLDDSRFPVLVHGVIEVDDLPAPALQTRLEEIVAAYPGVVPCLDRTGLGWAVVGNMNLRVPTIGVAITAGREVHRIPRTSNINIPRAELINGLALGIERQELAIPRRFGHLVTGLLGAHADKADAFSDEVDALMLAWWSHLESTRGRRIGTKPPGM